MQVGARSKENTLIYICVCESSLIFCVYVCVPGVKDISSQIHMTRDDFDVITENGKHLGPSGEFNRCCEERQKQRQRH